MNNEELMSMIRELATEISSLKVELAKNNQKIEMLQASLAIAKNPNITDEQTKAYIAKEDQNSISKMEIRAKFNDELSTENVFHNR